MSQIETEVVARNAGRAAFVAPLRVDVSQLSNTYFGLRHPHALTNSCAESNRSGRLVSLPGSEHDHGLSDKGRQQLLGALPAILKLLRDTGKPIVLLGSQLNRCREPLPIIARAVERVLGVKPKVVITSGLNERHWGVHEGRDESNWRMVREADIANPAGVVDGVESEISFLGRKRELFLAAERAFQGHACVLLGHCDGLQGIEELCSIDDLAHYSEKPEFGHAEIRRIA